MPAVPSRPTSLCTPGTDALCAVSGHKLARALHWAVHIIHLARGIRIRQVIMGDCKGKPSTTKI